MHGMSTTGVLFFGVQSLLHFGEDRLGPGVPVTGGLGGGPVLLWVLLLVVRIGMHCTSTKNLFPGWHACTASSVVPMCVGGAVRGRVVCQWSLRRWLPSLAVFRDHGGVVFVVMGRPHGTGNSKRSFGGKVGPVHVHGASSVPLPGLHWSDWDSLYGR